jgi:hypothetical protein
MPDHYLNSHNFWDCVNVEVFYIINPTSFTFATSQRKKNNKILHLYVISILFISEKTLLIKNVFIADCMNQKREIISFRVSTHIPNLLTPFSVISQVDL